MNKRKVLTNAGGGGTAEQVISRGFTMAEILLSLTIIGVVAAITLPSLTGNINERTWNTQRKALYARFSQAIALMPALNGYGTLTAGDESTSAVDTATETFVTSGLAKVLKINNICDSEHITDCGVASRITAITGTQITVPTTMEELNPKMIFHDGTAGPAHSQLNTKAAAFETANGESIIAFYNPYCKAEMGETGNHSVQPKICANFVFDLNGNKGPNTVGKDIGFITVLYPTDSSVVAPNIPPQKASTSATQQRAMEICKEQDPEFRIPTRDELASMFVNQRLINGAMASGSATNYWSATIYDSTHGWTQGMFTGGRLVHFRSLETTVQCVKR
ncbi:MAG: prepilin-type N-terminal cleavage/methylation domain-containing protein [Fusobacterium sp.]|nr:prepilin-type N-terminal cleavage/methylation domain-containing protein [Fusobacterium sp.]